MPATHSGFMIQGNRRRDNDDPKLFWVGPRLFGSGKVGVSLIRSNLGTPGIRNLELIARESNRLAYYSGRSFSEIPLIVAFLETLSGEAPEVIQPQLP